MRPTCFRTPALNAFAGLGLALAVWSDSAAGPAEQSGPLNQVLEWNQIFIDTLVTTNTANSSSQRLGAIVHTAIFDAYNGVDRRYTPIFVHDRAPHHTSRRAAVIAAAYIALGGLFSPRQSALDTSYAASLDALRERCGGNGDPRRQHRCERRIERGIAWGTEVAQRVLAWRATDGFTTIYPSFTGGTAVGQWRPTPPAFGPMSAQGLAFTEMFVLASNTQFQPEPPRTLASPAYAHDVNTVKALGRQTGSTRTEDQTALAPFWEGNASVHWNQAANQIARAHHLTISQSNRLLAVLNIAMADTALTIWSAKRHYGEIATEVTWRPVTAIPLAESDGHPDTAADAEWRPLVNTPSHPEYPAGHPGLNGAAATVLSTDVQRGPLTADGCRAKEVLRTPHPEAARHTTRSTGGRHGTRASAFVWSLQPVIFSEISCF